MKYSFNVEKEVDHIIAMIDQHVFYTLYRTGVVLGISGGVDSSVCAALCARALGKENVLGLMMPERDSSSSTTGLSETIASFLGINTILEDITPILIHSPCYHVRDKAIQSIIPEYTPEYKCKVVNSSLLEDGVGNEFSIVVRSPQGRDTRAALPPDILRAIVAATNNKQRVRKLVEYYYADLYHYAVVGTPNRLEYELGFFVKNGDGAADLKPIAHLYKREVYEIAGYLGIPAAIREAPSTTDTYSLEQTQEEFYFAMPLLMLDQCLWGKNKGMSLGEVALMTGLTEKQAEVVFNDIDYKKSLTEYQRLNPVMLMNEDGSGNPSPFAGV
jgi:NAD+ synthase